MAETPHHLRLMLDVASRGWAYKRVALQNPSLPPTEQERLRGGMERLNLLMKRYTAQLRDIEMAQLR